MALLSFYRKQYSDLCTYENACICSIIQNGHKVGLVFQHCNDYGYVIDMDIYIMVKTVQKIGMEIIIFVAQLNSAPSTGQYYAANSRSSA